MRDQLSDCKWMGGGSDGKGFRLYGQKTFVLDGANGDRLLVLARTADGRLFDFPADTCGITRVNPQVVARVDAPDPFENVEPRARCSGFR